MLKLHKGIKVCPACGERTYNGAKTCKRKGCYYSWAPVKMRSDTCRQDYFNPTSIPNPTVSTNFVSKGMNTMSNFTPEDTAFSRVVPPDVRYLGTYQHFDAFGRAYGNPKYKASHPDFENGLIFYASDRRQLMSLCWKIIHSKLKCMPNEYKKNGCGVEKA